MLRIDQLGFTYPGYAPYLFDLTVAPGEIAAVTGASGSGKSTLLDLIAGFLRPTGGSVLIDDTDITALPPEQRPVSILFQADNLFDHLSVAANLALGLPKALPKAERETRITSALKDVGLEGLGPRRAANLSGGQKQRVALARTLLRDRPILLLDEPFSGLDPETASAMRQLVRDLTKARQWHVIIVSHDETDVKTLASTHFALNEGTLSPLTLG